jgi:hypothetical protein
MTNILRTKKVSRRTTTMKAIADQGNRGLPPESELRVYEFGNGTHAKKARDYQGVFNESTGLWE